MLIEKPITKNDTVSIKLTSGEEVIACFIEETDTKLTVEKPATIAQGPQGMGIVPWMITSKTEKISLNRNSVVAYTVTEDEIAKAYIQATTNIQLTT